MPSPPNFCLLRLRSLRPGGRLTSALSFSDCAKACLGCMGAGPGRCKKCSRGYQQVGSKCLGESSAKGGWSMEGARMHTETVGVKCSLGCCVGNHGSQHSDLLPHPHHQMWMSVRQWCVQERTSNVKTPRVATAVSVLKASDRRTASV